MKKNVLYQGQGEGRTLKADYWRLLSLSIQKALDENPNGAVLIRFHQSEDLSENAAHEASHTLASIVAVEAERLLAKDDVLVCFDDMSYVLIANLNNHENSTELATKLVNAIDQQLMGSILGKSSPDVSSVVSVTETGIEIDDLGLVEIKAGGGDKTVPSSVEAKGNVELIGTASFDFLPIWHVRKSFVTSFECVPRWHLDDGAVLDEADLSARFQEHRMEHILDAQTVHHAVDQLIHVMEHDAMATILVPIHYDTIMEDEGFEAFLVAYSDLMPVWRERVSLEIKCIPQDATFEDVKKAVHRLRPYCHGLYLQVPFGCTYIGDYGVDGLVSIGLDLTHDERDEAEVISDMETFIEDVLKYNDLHTHALGLKTISLSVAAVCAGFDFIGSKPIERELEGWGIDDFLVKPIDLYKQLLKSVS